MHNLKKWVQDSVELYAKVVDADPQLLTTRACFLFKYNGKKHRAYENTENYPRGCGPKYCRRYIGKTVKILYSPKYDEVMVVRQAPSEENK